MLHVSGVYLAFKRGSETFSKAFKRPHLDLSRQSWAKRPHTGQREAGKGTAVFSLLKTEEVLLLGMRWKVGVERITVS